MPRDVVKEALDKYRNIILSEKGKHITISIEQLNALHDDITRLQNENERLKIDNEKLSSKAEEQEKKARSWCAKYNHLLQKTNDEIFTEIREQKEEQLKQMYERKFKFDCERKEAELLSKHISDVQKEADNRIQRLNEIKEEFSKRLSEEKDRYEQEYDLENERNQGYLIGIAKTRKTMLEVFDEKLKPKNIRLI